MQHSANDNTDLDTKHKQEHETVNIEKVQNDSESDNDDEEEDLADLEPIDNAALRPFRDDREHVNSYTVSEPRQRSSNSMCSTASTVMDPAMVKRKVKRQAQRKQKQQYARRVRKQGEAALVTKTRRENCDTIKQSTSAAWF